MRTEVLPVHVWTEVLPVHVWTEVLPVHVWTEVLPVHVWMEVLSVHVWMEVPGILVHLLRSCVDHAHELSECSNIAFQHIKYVTILVTVPQSFNTVSPQADKAT